LKSKIIPSPLLEVFLRNMKYLEVIILAFDEIEFNRHPTGCLWSRDDGTKIPFLSDSTLHMVDYALWMLPFGTKTDLNKAATEISHDLRNSFLKMMLDEHSQRGARVQLKELWAAWIEQFYSDTAEQSAGSSAACGAAPTPPDSPRGQAAAAATAMPNGSA
jgi:hypothetical protein